MSKPTKKTQDKAESLGINITHKFEDQEFSPPSNIFDLVQKAQEFINSFENIKSGIFTGTYDDAAFYQVISYKNEEELLAEISLIEESINEDKNEEILVMKELIRKYKQEALEEVNK